MGNTKIKIEREKKIPEAESMVRGQRSCALTKSIHLDKHERPPVVNTICDPWPFPVFTVDLPTAHIKFNLPRGFGFVQHYHGTCGAHSRMSTADQGRNLASSNLPMCTMYQP